MRNKEQKTDEIDIETVKNIQQNTNFKYKYLCNLNVNIHVYKLEGHCDSFVVSAVLYKKL